jgi:hypothetical protein
MTWWLNASEEQLQHARTCNQCGCGDADIDLGLCFECFSNVSLQDQHLMNASIARKYGQHDRAENFERLAAEAETAEPTEAEKDAFFAALDAERQMKLDAHDDLAQALRELEKQAALSLDYRPEFRRAIANAHEALSKIGSQP